MSILTLDMATNLNNFFFLLQFYCGGDVTCRLLLIHSLYLVNFVPALSVLNAHNGIVVKECLAEHRRGFGRDGAVERRETLRVLDVGRGAQIEQGPNRFDVVLLGGPVEGRGAAAGPVVDQGPAAHQGEQQGSRPGRSGRYRERRF